MTGNAERIWQGVGGSGMYVRVRQLSVDEKALQYVVEADTRTDNPDSAVTVWANSAEL